MAAIGWFHRAGEWKQAHQGHRPTATVAASGNGWLAALHTGTGGGHGGEVTADGGRPSSVRATATIPLLVKHLPGWLWSDMVRTAHPAE